MLYLALAIFSLLSVLPARPTDDGQNGPDYSIYGVTIAEIELDLLQRYSQYSAATYCNVDKQPGDPVTCEANCDRVLADRGTIVQSIYTGPETDIGGYVAVVPSRKEIIFAARGTASDQNWHTNLDIWMVPSNLTQGAMVHQGFSKAALSIADNVRGAIDKALLAHRDFRIIFTGHSLGGALAPFIGAHLRAQNYPIDIYTYGQPRVGNDKFSDFISNQPGNTYRVTHEADPVPRIPFTILGYRHTSPEIWLTGNPSNLEPWPIEDVEICEGNLNRTCNANRDQHFNAVDHGIYFGKMTCFKDPEPFNSRAVYFPEYVQDQIEANVETDKAAA